MLHGQNIVPDPIENFLEAIEAEWYYETSWSKSKLKRESKNEGCVFVFFFHQAAHKRCSYANSNTRVYEYFHTIPYGIRGKLTTLYTIKVPRESHKVFLWLWRAQKSRSYPKTPSTGRFWRCMGAWLGDQKFRWKWFLRSKNDFLLFDGKSIKEHLGSGFEPGKCLTGLRARCKGS